MGRSEDYIFFIIKYRLFLMTITIYHIVTLYTMALYFAFFLLLFMTYNAFDILADASNIYWTHKVIEDPLFSLSAKCHILCHNPSRTAINPRNFYDDEEKLICMFSIIWRQDAKTCFFFYIWMFIVYSHLSSAAQLSGRVQKAKYLVGWLQKISYHLQLGENYPQYMSPLKCWTLGHLLYNLSL